MVILILAGGSSSRLGQPKQLLEYQGKSLIKNAVKTALQSELGEVIVVSGFLNREIVQELKDLPVEIVHNPNWQKGIGSSIKTGISAVERLQNQDQKASALIMLTDQPLITSEHLKNLSSLFYGHKNSMIMASNYAGTSGVPAIFDYSFFPDLLCLPDNRGAQFLFDKHQHKLLSVPFSEAAIDIDTPEDYQKLIGLKT